MALIVNPDGTATRTDVEKIDATGPRRYGTFNVNEFRSKLDSLGGPSRSTLFRVEIIVPDIVKPHSGKIDTGTLSFLVASVAFPGVRLTTHPIQRYGMGPQEDMPTGVVVNNCDMNILGDADGHILKFFRNWMRGIVEYQSVKGDTQENRVQPGMKPFHVNYKKKIETQVTIVLYNPSGDQVYKVSLSKAFPADVSSLFFSWSNSDLITYIPVRFSFFDLIFGQEGDFVKGQQAAIQTLSVMEQIYSGASGVQSILNAGQRIRNVNDVTNAINNTVSGIKRLGGLFGV